MQRVRRVLKGHKVIKVPQELVLKVLQEQQVLKVQQVREEQQVLKEILDQQVHKVHKDIKEILDLQEHKEMLVLDRIL